LNLNSIQTALLGTVAGAHRSAPVCPCFTTGHVPLSRAPPTSSAAGPLPATLHRRTFTLAPRPHTSPPCGATRDPSPTLRRVTYKAHPSLLPPFFLSALSSGRPSTPIPPINTTTPSRGCSSTGAPSPHWNLAGELPPLPRHPLPIS
jgi:hypothetical protein